MISADRQTDERADTQTDKQADRQMGRPVSEAEQTRGHRNVTFHVFVAIAVSSLLCAALRVDSFILCYSPLLPSSLSLSPSLLLLLCIAQLVR